jgi:hypothetical protein
MMDKEEGGYVAKHGGKESPRKSRNIHDSIENPLVNQTIHREPAMCWYGSDLKNKNCFSIIKSIPF